MEKDNTETPAADFELDKWIEKLRKCELIKENEVKAIYLRCCDILNLEDNI